MVKEKNKENEDYKKDMKNHTLNCIKHLTFVKEGTLSQTTISAWVPGRCCQKYADSISKDF